MRCSCRKSDFIALLGLELGANMSLFGVDIQSDRGLLVDSNLTITHFY